MSQIPNHPDAEPGETAWEGFHEGDVAFQRACPDCDKGLIYAPVRFCPRCGGDGYLVRHVRGADRRVALNTDDQPE